MTVRSTAENLSLLLVSEPVLVSPAKIDVEALFSFHLLLFLDAVLRLVTSPSDLILLLKERDVLIIGKILGNRVVLHLIFVRNAQILVDPRTYLSDTYITIHLILNL